MRTAQKLRAMAVAAGFAALASTTPARALTVTDVFSGTVGGYAFSGSMTLDVVSGQAQSGTGYISILGLTDVPMVLITPSTPGNETNPGPVGFRANDGTDYGGLDTNYPVDSAGLLFDVDTTVAAFGQYPLFNLGFGTNETAFTGKVNGTEYYNLMGTATITPTPLPSSWIMMLVGLAGLGFVGYRQCRKGALAAAA